MPCHLFLFDHWKILKFTFRTFIVFAVVFIYFQLCRDEDQFPPDKFLADLFQRSAADRTGFFFPEKIQILFSIGTPLKRSASVALAFRFFEVFSGRHASSSSAFAAAGSCSISASLKSSADLGYQGSVSHWKHQTIFSEKGDFLFQIIPFLGEGLFPFVGSIDSCLKCFYHFLRSLIMSFNSRSWISLELSATAFSSCFDIFIIPENR